MWKYILSRSFQHLTRNRTLTIILCVGLITSFSLISGISGSVIKYKQDAIETFDTYNGKLVLVERGVTFINGLPINSEINKNVEDSIAQLKDIEGFASLIWSPKADQGSSVLGDLIIGIGNGSFGEPAYDFFLNAEIEGRFGRYNMSEVVIGKGTSFYTRGERVGSFISLDNQEYLITGLIRAKSTVMEKYVVMSQADYFKIFQDTGSVSMIVVSPKKGVSLRDLESEIEKEFPDLNALNQTERDILLEGMVKSINDLTTYVAFTAFVSSLIMVIIFSQLSLRIRKKEIGIKRAIGTSEEFLMLEIFSEYFILVGFASIMGTIIGVISASYGLYRIGRYNIGEQMDFMVEFAKGLPIGINLFIVVMLSIMSALFSVIMISREEPGKVIKNL